ncbi:MAG: hypothetical protein IJ814_02125 [Paludibacteraceae bacterium]|nr:hypothetical protein [Paludibacteraceae bacterium]
MKILLAILTALVTDTARTDLTLSGSFGQGTQVIEGTQRGGFAVEARSVYDFNEVSRVFGEASYRWEDCKQTRYVDNADFRLTAPYLTVDTLGGDMRRETYAFYGGYRMRKNHIVWHAALQFRAEQSYRMRDPRAKNKVSDLRVEASIGYQWQRYALSLMAYGGRYKQNNEVRFYSELGETTIYHMANDTEPYARFSSNNKISYYSGYRAGVGLQLLPVTGFMAGLSYDWIHLAKELTINTQVPITGLRTHTLSAQAGYVAASWRVHATAALELKRGEQYIYGDNANNYYQLLLISPNYRRNTVLASLYGDYRLPLPVGDMLFAGTVDYDAFMQHVQECVRLQYTFPLKGKFSWLVGANARLHQYDNAHAWQVGIETGLTF